MSDPGHPVYLVNAEGDPIRLVIQGRASYTNCGPVQQFLDRIVSEGKTSLDIDFGGCTGMDSTFMGLLAGAAMNMRLRKPEPGEITLRRLSQRNLELIRNLGLHRLLKVADSPFSAQEPAAPAPDAQRLESDAPARSASHETILQAHENLMKADPANVAKFQDVVAFLRREAPPKP